MTTIRKTTAIVVALIAALLLWATLTMPAIAATAPAILTLACAAVAWFLWPRKSA